jgi:hypothetical protein
VFGPSSGLGYRVTPKTIIGIRQYALAVRKSLVRRNATFFEMAPFIDRLHEYGIVYDVVDTDELPLGIEACCVPEQRLITFSATTYSKACGDDPRARFTVIHELGHILLAHTRPLNRDNGRKIEAYEDSEWQANQFAAEFLMPLDHMVKNGYRTVDELILAYQVSSPAAERRINQLRGRNELPYACK